MDRVFLLLDKCASSDIQYQKIMSLKRRYENIENDALDLLEEIISDKSIDLSANDKALVEEHKFYTKMFHDLGPLLLWYICSTAGKSDSTNC